MKSKRFIFYIMLLLVIAVSACVATPNGDSMDAMDSPLPLEANSPITPPVAVEPEPTAIVVEVDETTGAVTGVLRALHKDGDVRPVPSAVIGLAELIPRDDGTGNIGAAYDPTNSPRTATDEDGIFILQDIEPGDYGVILDAVIAQSLLSYPDGSGDLIIKVEAGKQTDLGILEYESLSFPDFTN